MDSYKALTFLLAALAVGSIGAATGLALSVMPSVPKRHERLIGYAGVAAFAALSAAATVICVYVALTGAGAPVLVFIGLITALNAYTAVRYGILRRRQQRPDQPA